MLYEEWKSRYKKLKNFNTVLQRCPRFWPLAPPRGMNPGVYSLGISEDPPRYLSSKFDASVRSDWWDISIWKTLTQCDGNGNANANVDDRGDYNSSPSYRRAKNYKKIKHSMEPVMFFLYSDKTHWFVYESFLYPNQTRMLPHTATCKFIIACQDLLIHTKLCLHTFRLVHCISIWTLQYHYSWILQNWSVFS